MKSNKNPHSDEIKIKIIRFFSENPASIDSARGIAAWIGESIENVKDCLEGLEKDKIVNAIKTNFVTGYSLTREKNILKKIKDKYLKKK